VGEKEVKDLWWALDEGLGKEDGRSWVDKERRRRKVALLPLKARAVLVRRKPRLLWAAELVPS
jgi:hypothetical protein